MIVMWITFFALAYVYAGVVAYTAASDDINREFAYNYKKKLAILVGFVVAWPFLPIFKIVTDN